MIFSTGNLGTASDFVRIQELRDDSISLGSSDSYFKADDDKLTNPSKRPFFLAIEKDLSGLDETAWEALKNEALPRLSAKVHGRGWEQLFSILNQARSYNRLAACGCTDIEFIPRSKSKTPDLRAKLDGATMLCEVKTIHISKDEIDRRLQGGVGTIATQVTSEFLKKLHRDIDLAATQMAAYDSDPATRRIAYVIINFDDSLHEYAPQYETQIREELDRNHHDGVEVVLDIKPPFYNAT